MTRLRAEGPSLIRRRRWTLAAVALGLLSPVDPARAQEKPQEFPSAIELVTVDVVVKDRKGNPVTGLGPSDFALLEDGRPQTITSFEQMTAADSADLSLAQAEDPTESEASSVDAGRASRLRRTFVIVFDQVHLTSLQADRGRRALSTFLTAALRDGDRLRLLAVDGWEIEGPTEEVRDELERLEGRWVPQQGPEALTEYEAMRIDRFDDGPLMLRVMERIAILTSGRRPRDREAERIRNSTPEVLGMKNLDEGYVKTLAKVVYQDSVNRSETTLGALETVLDNLTTVRGRKSVILVSSALIQDPNLPGFRRVVEASNRANAALYFIDARGLEGMPGENAEYGTMLTSIDLGIALSSQSLQAAGAEGLAADTGGFTVKNRNDLASGFRQIAAETRSYYLLGYAPPPPRAEGEFRKIQVKVARKGVEVRARKGYYASLPGPASTKRAASEARIAQDDDADIPLRTASYVFGDAGAGKLRALVAVEADIRGLRLENRSGVLHGSLDLVIEVTRAGGGAPDRFVQQVDVTLTPERRKALETRGLPLARAVDLVPGEYEARIALSDRKSGRVGAASHRFEVPAEGFRVSTPILSDVMEPGADAGRDVPALGSRRRFPENRTLYFQYEVYGAKADPSTGEPAVVSGWVIRDRSGTEWARADPAHLDPTDRGAPGRLAQVDLTFPPGDYTLVLDARDQVSARRVEVREPFTVEAARP